MGTPSGPSRRAVVGGLVSTAVGVGCGGADPRHTLAERVAALDPRHVSGWVDGVRAEGLPADVVLDACLLAGVARSLDREDLHALLVIGPAGRIGAAGDDALRWRLVAWVLTVGAAWWEVGAPRVPVEPRGDLASFEAAVAARDPARAAAALAALASAPDVWPAAVAAAATVTDSDPHPTIYASEAVRVGPRLATEDRVALLASVGARLAGPVPPDPQRDALSERIRAEAAALSGAPATGPRTLAGAAQVARAVLAGGPGAVPAVAALGAGLGIDAVRDGLRLAAALGAGWPGGPVNDVHASTVTNALDALGRVSERVAWHAALTAVARLAVDGPVVAGDPVMSHDPHDPPAPAAEAAAFARASAPGDDPHDLKFAEAVWTAVRTVPPEVASRIGAVAWSAR